MSQVMPSVQDLYNLQTDLADFAEFLNTPDVKDITTRLGKIMPSLKKIVDEVRRSNSAYSFQTLAELIAAGNPQAISGDDDNDVDIMCRVWNDPVQTNNRLYGWDNNTLNWVPSVYSPPHTTDDINAGSLIDVPTASAVRRYLQVDTVVPAGANLLDVENALDGYLLEPTGDLVSNVNYRVSDYIKVTPGESYSVYVEATGPNPIAITNYLRKTCYYDASLNVVAGGSSEDVHNFTVPGGVAYVRVSVYNNKIGRLQTLANDTTNPDPIIETYRPVKMVGNRKAVVNEVFNGKVVNEGQDDDSIISLLTLLTRLRRYGEIGYLSNNLADPAAVTPDALVQTDGSLKDDGTYSTSDFIPVTEGLQYFFISTAPQEVGRRYAFYDASYAFVSFVDNQTYVDNLTVPSGNNIAYIRFSYRTTAAYFGFGRKLLTEPYAGGLYDERGEPVAVERVIKALALEEADSDQAVLSRGSIQRLIAAAGVNLNASRISDVNLINPNAFTVGAIMDDDGTITQNTAYAYSEKIAVTPGTTYTASYNSSTYNVLRKTTYFDEFDNVVPGGSDGYSYTFTVPDGVAFVVVTVDTTRDLSLFTLQTGTGTDYVAYSPLYAIRAEDGENKTFTDDDDIATRRDVLSEIALATDSIIEEGRVSDVNLIEPGTDTVGQLVFENGTISALPAYSYSARIPVVAGETYTGNYNGSTFEVFRKATFYDEFGAVVSGLADYHYQFTVPAGAVEVIVTVRSDREYGLHCLQLGTSTAYVAYTDARYARFRTDIQRGTGNPNDVASRQDITDALAGAGLTSRVTLANSDKILFTGCSYDEGGYGLAKKSSWINKLADFTGYIVGNHGVGGQRMIDIAKRLREDTTTLGITPSTFNPTYITLANNGNEYFPESGEDLTLHEGQVHLVKSAIDGLGAKMLMGTNHHVNGNPFIESHLKALADSMGCDYMGIGRVGEAVMATEYREFWGGSHPGTRNNAYTWLAWHYYIQQLPRPRRSIKLYRARNPATPLSSLHYDNALQRVAQFQDLQVGEVSLSEGGGDAFYDRLDSGSYATQTNNSEYAALLAGQPVTFDTYALMEIITEQVQVESATVTIDADAGLTLYLAQQRDLNSAATVVRDKGLVFEVDETTYNSFNPATGTKYTASAVNSGNTEFAYTGKLKSYAMGRGWFLCFVADSDVSINQRTSGPGNLVAVVGGASTAYTNQPIRFRYDYTFFAALGQPVSRFIDASAFTSYADGQYSLTLPPASLLGFYQFDTVRVLAVGSGEFTVSDVALESVGGVAKPVTTTLVQQSPYGSELIAPRGFDDSATGWQLNGNTVAQMAPAVRSYPASSELGDTHHVELTLDADGFPNLLEKTVALTGAPGSRRGWQRVVCRVIARLFPPIYNPTESGEPYTDTPVISTTSCDYGVLCLSMQMTGSSDPAMIIKRPVDIGWAEIVFETTLPVLSDSVDIALYREPDWAAAQQWPMQIYDVSIQLC